VKANFSLAAYRYSTSSFYSLQDAVAARNISSSANGGTFLQRPRNRFQIYANQALGSRSTFYISGSAQDYWGKAGGSDVQFQVGLNSAFKRLSYSLYVQRSQATFDRKKDTQIGLSFTIPLGKQRSSIKRNVFDSLSASLSRGSNKDSTVQMDMSGGTSGRRNINYGINASRIDGGDNKTTSIGTYATYRSPIGTYSANASAGNQIKQAGINANGAVLIHRGGVTLSPPLGLAFALIEAKGAKGGEVQNGQGATIDRFGYAVVPSLRPYRVNTVSLSPQGLSQDVELGNSSVEVVPRLHSMVLVKINTTQGRPIIAMTEDTNGKALPIGTELLDETGKTVGMVGQAGMAFVRGVEGAGKMTAQWGTGENDQCALPYSIPIRDKGGEKGNLPMTTRVRLRCELPSLE